MRSPSFLLAVVFLLGCGRYGYDAEPLSDVPEEPGFSQICGDGITAAGEACDDGNGEDGDGCDNDCTPSCETHEECADGNPCNGWETCEAGRCISAGQGPELCDSTTGTLGICRAGSCAPATCGDGQPQLMEACDDGNTVSGDGCENDCRHTCESDFDCDDRNACNGAEQCSDAFTCVTVGLGIADGTACERDANPMTPDICLAGMCSPSYCGDGFLDTADEVCDDGNMVEGDGCNADCRPSCLVDPDCDDGRVCNGLELCNAGRCEAGTQTVDGVICPEGSCASGWCVGDGT